MKNAIISPSTRAAFGLASLLAIAIAAPVTSASAQTILFGSGNAGYGGFTTGNTTPISPDPAWSLVANAARFDNDGVTNTGQVNSSLLDEFTLNRTSGSSYTITGVLDMVSTYAADNNRLGMSLFATSSALAGIDTGLSLQLNLGDGVFAIRSGVNGGNLASAAYNGLNGASAIGTTFTYQATVDFVGTDIELDFTLTDQNSFSQTLSTTVAAASYTGEFFGFGTRGRVRGGAGTDADFIYEADSFSVVAVPEPTSLAFACGAIAIVGIIRRRKRAAN